MGAKGPGQVSTGYRKTQDCVRAGCSGGIPRSARGAPPPWLPNSMTHHRQDLGQVVPSQACHLVCKTQDSAQMPPPPRGSPGSQPKAATQPHLISSIAPITIRDHITLFNCSLGSCLNAFDPLRAKCESFFIRTLRASVFIGVLGA